MSAKDLVSPTKIKVGDKIRITEDRLYAANVQIGDVLEVSLVDGEDIETLKKDSRREDGDRWYFFAPGCRPNNTPDGYEVVEGASPLTLAGNVSPMIDAIVGVKHDGEKPDMSLLPAIGVLKVGEVMTYGKKKYAAHNWRNGLNYSRLLSAALRHVFAYVGGESKDPETGFSHLAHAVCCLLMVLEFEDTRPDLDDRYVNKTKTTTKES